MTDQVERAQTFITEMHEARKGPSVTCPASRHVQYIAEWLAENGEKDFFEQNDPAHCAESLASVVTSLWRLRDVHKAAIAEARQKALREAADVARLTLVLDEQHRETAHMVREGILALVAKDTEGGE